MHVMLHRGLAVNVVFCEAFEIGVLLSLSIDFSAVYGGLLFERDSRFLTSFGFFFFMTFTLGQISAIIN